MKILFLDIDGVCNSAATAQRHQGFIGIDPYMAFLVGKIQLDTGCEVVLSSTWRLHELFREEVRKQVVNFIDITPNLGNGGRHSAKRGREVRKWLRKHPEVTRYAILDDDNDFYKSQPLFQTSWNTGLTPEIAKKVTDYLNEVAS